jgi:hypothetical protein
MTLLLGFASIEPRSCCIHGEHSLPTLPLLTLEAILQMGSALYQLCLYWPSKLFFTWGALHTAFPPISVGSCSSNEEHSPSPLPMSGKQPALQIKNTPYLMRPLTRFHNLAIFAPYLPAHSLELTGNSAFN